MKKSNYILTLMVFIASGCTQRRPETLIARWEKKILQKDSLERKLASGVEGECLKDLFNTTTLKTEAMELERKFENGEKVAGSWKHLNLSHLPVAQANFFKSYGGMIGDLKDPDSIDYSSCHDLPCVINRIYGEENSVHGYVHYLWYLKTGQLLAADNMVPGQRSKTAGIYNRKTFQLADYLFDKNELYAFWRLSHMLKSPHTTLKHLKEIQRIPRGEKLEGHSNLVCGLASSAGTIRLSDRCLEVNDSDWGFFYQAVTHELTHHVDFEQGREARQLYRSHRSDYLEIAGMFINEYMDEAGFTHRQWEFRPNAKLVTNYARTNPQENFAESIAVFRVSGDQAKSKITENHYDFLSKQYYQGRAFDREALIQQWITKYAPEINKEIFQSVSNCSQQKSAPHSAFFKFSDFSSLILPATLNCLGNEAVEITRSVRAKTLLHEPEGCISRHTINFTEEWNHQIKEFLKSSFNKHLQKLQEDSQYIARIQSFYKEVSDPSIARSAFISCYQESNEEACFNHKIREGAMEKASFLKLSEEPAADLAQIYMTYHSYESTKNQTKDHYRIFVTSQQESIINKAEILWQGCNSIKHHDDAPPRGNDFHVGHGYMVSSFYNCLNKSISDVVQDVVRSLSVDSSTVQDDKEELILSELILPELLKTLQRYYEKEKAKEKEEALLFIHRDQGELRRKILSDFKWITNIVDTEQIFKDCKREGYKLLPFSPLYHLKAELFSDFLQNSVCQKISLSSEFNWWLNSSNDAFHAKVYSGIEKRVTDLAEAQAINCLKRYPIDSTISKFRFREERQACLVDQWSGFEEQALRETGSDSVVMKFQVSQKDLRQRLSIRRRRLQLRVIKRYFD